MLIISQGFLQPDNLGKLNIYETYSPDKQMEQHEQQGKPEELWVFMWTMTEIQQIYETSVEIECSNCMMVF